MAASLTSLSLATAGFVGSHFLMSHPLRKPMLGGLGAVGFQLVYSLVSLAAFLWMVMMYRGSGPATTLADPHGLSAAIASLLTLIALVLLFGSVAGNPALPAPRAAAATAREPRGALKVTRHPMMWGFALWAIAHMIMRPDSQSFVFHGGILVLALLGSAAQDRKKRRLMRDSWREWERKTSFWPSLHRLPMVGIMPWLVGVIVWIAASWLHGRLAGFEVGLFALL